MTTLTIKINERTKAGKAFMAMAEVFFKDAKGIEIIDNPVDLLSDKDEAYLKRLRRSAKQAKEIAQGNREGKSLNDFLNEV
jgi:hypothetical protein